MLKVPPKTCNTKDTTTSDHDDRTILPYSRANLLPRVRYQNMENIVHKSNRLGANTTTICIWGEKR